MSWKKRGFGEAIHYIIDNSDQRIHLADDLTLADLNEPNRHFTFTRNQRYITEYMEEANNGISILPAGTYRLSAPDRYTDPKLYPWKEAASLKLFELDVVKDVLQDFADFRQHREIYKKLGSVYKRGILLYGPPGTGKTSAINMILGSLKLDESVIVMYVENAFSIDFIRELKRDTRLKVFIFEELTQAFDKHDVNAFLTFLDGENSLDNSYILATTNYPEQLPGNIVERPGRFDQLFRINEISLEDRRRYFEYFLERAVTPHELKITAEYPMAFLREIILLTLKRSISIEEAVRLVKQHKDVVKANFKENVSDLGFDNDDD